MEPTFAGLLLILLRCLWGHSPASCWVGLKLPFSRPGAALGGRVSSTQICCLNCPPPRLLVHVQRVPVPFSEMDLWFIKLITSDCLASFPQQASLCSPLVTRAISESPGEFPKKSTHLPSVSPFFPPLPEAKFSGVGGNVKERVAIPKRLSRPLGRVDNSQLCVL